MQTIGRSARNVNAKVILYADEVTESMRRAIEETERRRVLQHEYNQAHGITPETIRKQIRAGIESEAAAHREANAAVGRGDEARYVTEEYLAELETEMHAAATALEFERAAALRDRIEAMRDSNGEAAHAVSAKAREAGQRRGGKRQRRQRVPRPKKRA